MLGYPLKVTMTQEIFKLFLSRAFSLNYRIFETNEFIKRVSKFSQCDALFIQDKLITYICPQWKKEPHFGNNVKKLPGYKPETWRYRIGRCRLFLFTAKELAEEL